MAPMRAAAEAWRLIRPDVRLEWATRPLEAFNDEPVEEIAAAYDLLVIDHPFSGTAAATGCLAPLDLLVPSAELATLAADAIGPSHTSYTYAGRQWAVAVDAACHVGAVRDDLLQSLGFAAPTSWPEVEALVDAAPGRVAIPLYPTDAICVLLTLLASRGEDPARGETFFVDRASGSAALAFLATLVSRLHPDSFDFNPPRALDRMRATDEIVAIPLLFGYTNYSRPFGPGLGSGRTGPDGDHPARIRFVDIPSAGRSPAGALLGGAGLAVSASSQHPEAAASFAAWACSAETQREIVFPAGGQPGSRTVWLDAELDGASGGFFSGTRASIEGAYVRPREAWWPAFQEAAGHVVAASLRSATDPEQAADELERLFAEHRAVENVV